MCLLTASRCYLRCLPSHSGQQTAKRVPSCCRRCRLECRSQSGASSEVQWIIMKSFTLAQNQTGILFIGTHVGIVSHWLISSEYDLVNATHMLPPYPQTHHMLFFPFHKTTEPPLPITSTPFPSPLAPAAVNSRIPVCDSVHPSLFSPALTTPSLHPFLSCVLCCQAQLDQACQSSQMQSLLVLKQAVLNPCLARPFMSVAFM